MNHTLKIVLDDKDEMVMRYLAREDGVTLLRELKQCFYLELEHMVNLYEEEARRDEATRNTR